MNKEKRIKILETTLRDGSYTINYQFNANETSYIAKILDEIGFEYIEIGPGIGFNAKEFSEHPPASSDEEYIIAAREVVKNAKIGMFFIPGIARESDIHMAAANKLDLIRVGTNVDEFDKGFKYLELCKKNNIETAANLMKSYAVDADEFARVANECYKAGADTVYLVDSAGGMFPEDVTTYLSRAKDINPDISLGFHGHDNLGLAIANTIAAIDCGVDIVDSSIRGMGRSSGNTVTEKLIFVLKRLGFHLSYDVNKLLDLSDKVILEYLSGKPEKSLDLIYGFSQFHSSFVGVIKKYSELHNIDAKDLIIEYTKIDKMNIDEKLADEIAKSLSKRKVHHFKIENTVVKKSDQKEQLNALCKELVEQKHKYNKNTFFNITQSYDNVETKVSPVIHSYENLSFASAEVNSIKEVNHIVNEVRSCIDGFLIDTRTGVATLEQVKNNFFYNDAKLFAKAINNYISAISKEKKEMIDKLFIEERDEIQSSFLDSYAGQYLIVEHLKDANIAIIGKGRHGVEDLEASDSLKWVIITNSGVLEEEAITKLKNISFIRIDLEHEVFTEIIEKMNYSILISTEYGMKEIDGTTYCSGGFIGPKGSIVVDNVNHIKHKYGISNGDGSISYFNK
jgi:4-hydroxy-2-oxovalerate aldolase